MNEMPPECRKLIADTTIFSVGDKVVSKKTGLPAMGRVIGSLPSYIYGSIMGAGCRFSSETQEIMICYPNGGGFATWNKLYPDWPKKYVIFVELPAAQLSMSFEEFCDSYSDYFEEKEYSLDEIKESYREHGVTTKLISYPEDDLELYEE